MSNITLTSRVYTTSSDLSITIDEEYMIACLYKELTILKISYLQFVNSLNTNVGVR